jgi:hypothetical protein
MTLERDDIKSTHEMDRLIVRPANARIRVTHGWKGAGGRVKKVQKRTAYTDGHK